MLDLGVTFLSTPALCRCCGALRRCCGVSRLLGLTFFASRVLCSRCSAEVLQVDIFVSSRTCTAATVQDGRGVTIFVTGRHSSSQVWLGRVSGDKNVARHTNLCLVGSSCPRQGLLQSRLLQSGADPGPGNSRQGCSGAGPGRGCSSVARGPPAREWCRCDRVDR